MGEATKKCPMCAEVIAASAKKCRFCNEWLDGSGGPNAAQISWQGDHLLVPFQATDEAVDFLTGLGTAAVTGQLPSHACWICAGSEQIALKTKRYIYTPPWVYLGLLGGILPAAILASIFQKRTRLSVPICGQCRRRWLLFDVFYVLDVLVGLFAYPAVCAMIGAAIDKQNGVPVGVLVGILIWFISLIIVSFLRGRFQLTCKRIENQVVTLAFPDPAVTRRALAPGGEDA
jgi:hypothetical protein